MNDRLKVGSYGHISFVLKKKWARIPKTFNGDNPIVGFRMMATITANDPNNIEIVDNDGMMFIIPRSQIRSFEEEELNIKFTKK